ncbi:MAG: D-2-hydroxyacid dehydrogenase [Aeromonadales bacterium]|nr:D-2-hydroxyacid dehydrogenase [Aeromonadales bacterium]MDY2891285.1 D-2-hydroxyacid dehydrogenase [Succinivibrio sp.]
MIRVLCVLPCNGKHKELLSKAGQGKCEFVFKTPAAVRDADLSGVTAVIGNIAPEVLKDSDVKLLQLNSAGYEAYRKQDLPEGIAVCNARGAYGLTVSEHMLALTFSLIRHLQRYRDRQSAHIWKDCGKVSSIYGSTVLVLGLGDIGGEYARKVKALGAGCVIGVRRNAKGEKPDYLDEQYAIDELDTLLPRADIVAMVLPGGKETKGLINKKRIALMKPGAYIVNCGRGSSIVQEDLLEALESGRIAGAAIDVCDPEPLPASSPLWDLENLIITPHVAGNFFLQETFERVVSIACDNLQRFILGQELFNQVI